MTDILRWWLVADLIGLAALPYTMRFFRFLPDRGIAVARPFGLLLVGYVLWLGAFAGVLPFTGGSAALVVAALGAGGVWLAGRDRAALFAALRARRGYMLAVEAVFLTFLIAVALLRAWDAEIAATEKPFESAFFQAVLRSETFGPRDPWYGGEPMSYYYYGYVLIGTVTKLAGTAPAVAFNLGLALTGALAAAAAFGLVYNLLAARGRLRYRSAILASLLAPLLLLVVSNLEGVFELVAIHGPRARWFYNAIFIENLTGPKFSDAWYPTEHWWWWRATRLGSSWNVEEFPFFSFLLGDLHAHVMVLPYVLTMQTAIFQLWRTGGSLDWRWPLRHRWTVLGLALLAGALYPTNAWDFPTALVLLGLVVLALAYRERSAWSWRPLLGVIALLAPVALLSVLLYLPFYIGFTATPSELRPTEVRYAEVEPWAMATPPFQFFVFWGPMLFPALSYLVWRARALGAWRWDSPLTTLALLVAYLPLAVWALLIMLARGPSGLGEELQARGKLLLTTLLVAAFVALAALVWLREIARDRKLPASGVHVLLAAMMLTALLLFLFTELFFIRDIVIISRHNTVFKFYYSAWLLLSVSGATGAVEIVSHWRIPRPRMNDHRAGLVRLRRVAWGGAGAVLLSLALVYPVMATLARTNRFRGTPTLDGFAALRTHRPQEYAATRWLLDNIEGMPVVLEAAGPEYSEGARVSARTGLPTVVGWPNHEWQQRGVLAPVLARVEAVRTLYTTDDDALARRLLAQYNVRYVYLGSYERDLYGSDAGRTLARIARPVFASSNVQIYAVEPGLTASGN